MIHLSPRLMCAVKYVRPGALLADVGTDHAYLPIYLCQKRILTPVTAKNGEILSAVASDINKGPVERAEQHIRAEGVAGTVRTVCTDGLNGLEVYGPETIIIFGMGGELIVSILEAAPWIRQDGVRLILQPMTHPEKLREALFGLGFAITGESLSAEGDRLYQIICADYAPASATPPKSPAEALTGHLYPHDEKRLHRKLIEQAIKKESRARNARNLAGQDTSEADILLASLNSQLEALGG
ncbi:MAG: SAM-dependent methyltransferase [Ruminococcaceae bacterium]|nr:SAM-dependent methyltransferase [Oscillospiraceae bacterium]